MESEAKDNFGFPLIGILAIPASETLSSRYFRADENFSYIPSSYVRYVTQTCAMAVLIPYDLPIETLNWILDRIQGIHLIGGSAYLGNDSTPSFFQSRVNFIAEKARKRNESGDYFPIFATCLGMQALTAWMAGKKPNLLQSGMNNSNTKG